MTSHQKWAGHATLSCTVGRRALNHKRWLVFAREEQVSAVNPLSLYRRTGSVQVFSFLAFVNEVHERV